MGVYEALDALTQGAAGFEDAHQAQAGQWPVEGQLRHFEQRRGVSLGLVAERQHDGIVHRFLTHAAGAGIGEPEQGMPPIDNLDQRLCAIYPNITAPEMDQFMQQYSPQLGRRKLLHQ